MYNRTHTLRLAELLNVLVIDLPTELEILDLRAPSIRDQYAVLDTARKLVSMDVSVPGCQAKQDIQPGKNPDDYKITELLEVREYFELKGNTGTAIELLMLFTEEGALFKTDVVVYGTTMAKRQSPIFDHHYVPERKGLVFENVDIAQFVAIPKLLGPIGNIIFQMLFNSDYDEDFIQMAELALDFALSNHLIFVEGRHYGRIAEHQNYSFYPSKGYHDLIELAALMFLNGQPKHGDIRFVLEPVSQRGDRMVLAVESVD